MGVNGRDNEYHAHSRPFYTKFIAKFENVIQETLRHLVSLSNKLYFLKIDLLGVLVFDQLTKNFPKDY